MEKEVATTFMSASARSMYQAPIPKRASFTDSILVPRISGKITAMTPTMRPPMAGLRSGFARSLSWKYSSVLCRRWMNPTARRPQMAPRAA